MPSTIPELPQTNAVSNSDLIIVETNPNSTPATKAITIENFKISTSNIEYKPAWVPPQAVHPTSLPTGTMFYDNSYIYIVVSNNLFGRVALDFWS